MNGSALPHPDGASLDRLRELHRSGRIPADYPQIAGLLADLPDEDLIRAGRLLAQVPVEAVTAAAPGTPVVSVAITGHGTLAALVPALTAQLARHGLLLRATVTDHDSWVFALSDPGGELHAADPDLALCLLDATLVFDEVPVPWQPADVQRVLEEKIALLEALSTRFAEHARGTLVLATLPLPRRYTAQLIDHRSRARLGALWREANARLLRIAEGSPRVVVIDLDPLVAEGVAAHDARLSSYAKAHLPDALLAAFAAEVGQLAVQAAGRGRKCLVLDLDGTLWGGILAEDGVEGIEIGEGYRGEAFASFQRVVKQLGSQGVLLAVASKNDLDAVRAALAGHPGMVLREDDFVRIVANWQPKPHNLRALAAELNIGVDSLVFVDDSAAEIGMVRATLPQVATVPVGADPAGHTGALLRGGWFDTRELTAEDRARGGMYRTELARTDFQQGFDSVEEYLRALGVVVRLTEAAAADVPRVAQITLRTNQFNLTTQRLQPAEVAALAEDRDALVLAIGAADRFGSNGTVGAVFAHWEGTVLHLDNMLLSCRVFGRGIEQATLSTLLRHAAGHGATAVVGRYAPTRKNAKLRDFLPANGFTVTGEQAGATLYRHDLVSIAAVPGHLTLDAGFAQTVGARR
ncbi:HAD-IIIC family phosphatase [Streptomyces sp. NPDC020983]|uniref:HAD-IIIC family phosphatase n=1 Tax=Streptomyces sp. NPDC020983 TaxID=3365106 RepID=UPI003791CC8D